MSREVQARNLIHRLEKEENLRETIVGLLKDSQEALDKAGFITRLFKAKALKEHAANKERCLEDIFYCDLKIDSINDELCELGYLSDDVLKIREAMDMHLMERLKRMCVWAELLNEQEQLVLFMDAVLTPQAGYAALLPLTGYIETFSEENEMLDFIHGFVQKEAQNIQTDAYKIGHLFYEVKSIAGIDLLKELRNYAPRCRHDVELVTLLADSVFGNCSDVQKKLKAYDFYGVVEFLGRGRQGNTIVGETLYFDNYREYWKEVKESHDCGRPISAYEISKAEYENAIKNSVA